ncbi:MAG: hypothetical protein BAJATHORv1_30008 [Candidatus Thorarchaeota archaeon]|nr:MAG: hypothetical protein BAJATHORv1_30008 [Candidatus Thorarchaeota archaeon]
MPEKVQCRYCGKENKADETICVHCGAGLSDAFKKVFCDRCGVPLSEDIDPFGKCVECQKPVYLCEKHKKKVVGEEVYCKEHESECFIATAVIGTPLDPHIDLLRDFRDEWLQSNPLGRAAVYTYYEISPPIANAIRHNSILRRVFRRVVVEPALSIAKTILGREET